MGVSDEEVLFSLEVFDSLRAAPFSLANEKRLQSEVHDRLTEAGFIAHREYRLDRRSIIDHAVEIPNTPGRLVGIECKVRADRAPTLRQCVRYSADERVAIVILLSQTALTDLPDDIWPLRPSGVAGLA